MNLNLPLPKPPPASSANLRQRAEASLEGGIPESVSSLSIQEARKLVHELRVYQVELEMQNEELRATESQYRVLAEFASEWIFWIDPQGRFRYVSPPVEALTGYAPGDFLDDPGLLLQLIHPEDRPAYLAHLDKNFVHQGVDPAELEIRIVRRDGTVRWVAHHCRPMFDAAGNCLGRRGSNRDITEHKKITAARQAADAMYRALFDHSMDAILLTTTEGDILAANTQAQRMLGYDEEELRQLGRPGIADTEDPRLETMLKQRDRENSFRGELTFRHRSGRKFPVEVASAVFIGATGQRLTSMVVRDITERNASEESLRKLSLAVEQSPNSIVITGLDASVEYINAAGERTSGYSRGELVGRNLRLLQSGKTPESTYADLWRTLSAGAIWQGEFVNQRKDGSEYIEFAIITPVRQADGRITHYLGIKEDITERKRVGRELDRHREHLQELVEEKTAALEIATVNAETANRAKSAFLANMSHEIRTPMNAIIGLTHLMKKDAPTPQQAERLNKVDAAAAHLLSIINDILDLSKIEAGKLALEEIDFSLADLFEQIRAILSDAATAKGLAIRIDRGSVPLWLRGDPTRLRQALLNYAGNAVKFTLQGEVVLSARMLEDRGERVKVRFEVRDTGIGIAPETLSGLFHAFQQADSSTTRKFGGTGLGLALVRRLAGLMDGEAGAESNPGVGSTFWLTAWLMRGQEAKLDLAPAGTTDAEVALKRRHSGARVLLVDDEPINREVALWLLEDAGLIVDQAADGREAVAQAVSRRYDVILMDVQMPHMDGLDATRAIRALPDGSAVPILAMTADAFAESRANCLAAGMNDFVSKPMEPQRMCATLLHWLDQTRGKDGGGKGQR